MRQLLAVCVLSFLASSNAVLAAQTTMHVGGYGGSIEKVFREKVIPNFEAKHNVKIVYVGGNSTETLTRLQADKGKQQFSVALIDDGPMWQAIGSSLCAKLKYGPIYSRLYYEALFDGFRSIGLGFIATGLVFNTDVFKRNGWAAPTSWKDLENKKFRGKVLIPPITNGYGLQTLLMGAYLNGGGEYAIDTGFSYLVDRVGPNVLTWEGNPDKMSALLRSGDAALGVWGNGRVQSMIDSGAPVRFVYPKEGAMAILTAACVVEGAPQSELGQVFVQHLLSEEVQELLAATQGWGPVNKDVKLPQEIAEKVVYGPTQVGKLIRPDYRIINPRRSEWTARWEKARKN